MAHNLPFDAQFLAAEFRRLGFDVPVGAEHGLCTMRLAGHFLPHASRSLHGCREAAGLPPHRAHSALHDARAAADLLACFLRTAGAPPPWDRIVDQAARAMWPALPTALAVPVSRRRPEAREPHFLTRLVDRLPRLRDPQADAYLGMLDRALLDRHISESEADGLVETATMLGLARVDVEVVHRRYLAGLAAIALEDGVLTTDERSDLAGVAHLVGLPEHAVDEALAEARDVAPPRARWHLRTGDQVVFTGKMDPPREDWEAEARDAGFDVGGNVTKKTRLLVAADPDSMSGEAKKARQYGIPIVHPRAYRQMLANPVAV
ncbi:hypothetical protein JIG36_38870 [Actinoplanes sp. LDG1-06]|uniref:Uncharacterized protein n=1 Tax=Paractinoplanes ovalisporus TaxID=2810368 RepID=A0ABS2AQL7_9ACTN|nr:hypothetical protein [Actinoplanes ovalisporus]